MITAKEQTLGNNKPASSEVFRAQTVIIEACNNVHQLNYVRECIQRTVDSGFDVKLAEQLYQMLDARKSELEAASLELAKN